MISTKGLTYRYTGGPALEFDDVDVPQGAVLLLNGASGSGKSTWLALVAALLACSLPFLPPCSTFHFLPLLYSFFIVSVRYSIFMVPATR